MPTYHCSARMGLLDAERKARIARAVTLAHAEVTGAPPHLAQVLFRDVPPQDHYVGGALLEHDHVFVHGHIRGGRSTELRAALVRRLTDDVAATARVDRLAVWVYLSEIPAAAMVEFGHVLPEAGQEAAWTEALPAADREHMEAAAARFRR
ncbi:MAG: 4-oxalocrotonate tautomerase [Gammaproteobacteria bacterium SG8_30]|jgi:phenylpyruvate tautomerase PptA (4-oxalocrotonate tautomerase family)|nr:MAG: 4-oxalocrotonate tautomerase [Gammaproteobacteria bacterium SG8_30]